MNQTDLNCSSPGEVSAVLRAAAQVYYQKAGDFDCTGQSWPAYIAGVPWDKIGRILERAAYQIDDRLARLPLP